jgi:hypothetical protein
MHGRNSMIQRLVWNFEFSHKKEIPLSGLVDNEQDDLKWERRFFWPENQIISLCNIDDSLLDLANYHQKHKEDTYYLLPHSDYNIKTRRDELQFKPVIRRTSSAAGFGIKINLDADDNSPELHEMAHQARKEGITVFVKKEAFIYKFHTHPNIKLELARLEVNNAVYFSACVEGKSLFLVETLSELLLGNQVSCEYVTFLKNITKL